MAPGWRPFSAVTGTDQSTAFFAGPMNGGPTPSSAESQSKDLPRLERPMATGNEVPVGPVHGNPHAVMVWYTSAAASRLRKHRPWPIFTVGMPVEQSWPQALCRYVNPAIGMSVIAGTALLAMVPFWTP